MGDHYIPRLLLRRFIASSTRSGNPMVFQFQRDCPAPKFPFSISSIASESGFYDYPDGPSLDKNGMHAHEQRVGMVLASIEAGVSPENFREDLAMLFGVTMTRTRSMRDEWAGMIDQLLDAAHRTMVAPPWTDALKNHVLSNLDSLLKHYSSECSPEERERIAELQHHPDRMSILQEFLRRIDLSGSADAFMSGLRSQLDPMAVMKKSQVEALLRVLREQTLPWLADASFQVIIYSETDECLVLGDACVVGMGEDGSFASPMALGPRCVARILPIGAHRVLLAVSAKDLPRPIAPGELNRASVSLSREFFFSSSCGDTEVALLSMVGTSPAPVSCAEIRAIAAESLAKFPDSGDIFR